MRLSGPRCYDPLLKLLVTLQDWRNSQLQRCRILDATIMQCITALALHLSSDAGWLNKTDLHDVCLQQAVPDIGPRMHSQPSK